METKDIKTLMELFAKLPLNEMKIESGDHALFLAKHANATGPNAVQAVGQNVIIQELAGNPNEEVIDPNLKYVTSPIVGTFYSAPNPKADAFVAIGDRVNTGQVICIVEAMKLMNEIQAEFPGEVCEILVENGQPVEYGQKLFSFKK